MKIKKLHLMNGYKRFFDLTIDLGNNPKKIIALVGSNGSGKSSVIDAMMFHVNAYSQVGNKTQKDYQYHSMNGTPNYDYQNVAIEFVAGSFSQVYDSYRKIGKEMAIFSLRSPYRYNSILNVSESRSVPQIRLNTYGATASSDLDDKMEDNYRRLYIKFNKFMNEVDCTPSQAKLKIIGDLNTSIKNCLDLEISSIGSIEASQGTLYFKKTDHPKEFTFNVLSSGEKEVVDILLDLYLRQEDYNDTIFLVDEPELHINTAIQRKLLIEIDKLIGENCQLWIATHSVGFLRALQEDLKDKCQIVHFKPEIKWASTTQTVTPERMSIAKWKSIFEIALDDLTHLISPRCIVYCEGRDKPGINGKENGLDAQVFNNIFSEKYHDTLFVSSGGNTELDQRSEIAIAIMSKVFSDIEILVLKDRDMASGKKTLEKERQQYLQNNPDSHRVLRRWEIENYLYDKEVLKKYCDSVSTSFDEISYDLLVQDIENQDLKDETAKIKNFCGIVTSINSEKFKINLSKLVTEDMAIFPALESCIFNRL